MVEGLENIDLAEVARSEGVELKRSGDQFVGLCPIHQEKTPSFFVFSNNKWKCWGCGASGDSIDLIRQIHGLSFPDALKHLELDQGPVTPETRKKIDDRKRRSELIRRFRRWESKKADYAGTMIRVIHQVATTWKTIKDFEDHGDILEMLPHLEHELDILCSKNDRKKFELLAGQEVRAVRFDLGRSIEVWINN